MGAPPAPKRLDSAPQSRHCPAGTKTHPDDGWALPRRLEAATSSLHLFQSPASLSCPTPTRKPRRRDATCAPSTATRKYKKNCNQIREEDGSHTWLNAGERFWLRLTLFTRFTRFLSAVHKGVRLHARGGGQGFGSLEAKCASRSASGRTPAATDRGAVREQRSMRSARLVMEQKMQLGTLGTTSPSVPPFSRKNRAAKPEIIGSSDRTLKGIG